MSPAVGVVPGWNDPSLPPLELPSLGLEPAPGPLRITVGPRPPSGRAAPGPLIAEAPKPKPPWADEPTAPPAPPEPVAKPPAAAPTPPAAKAPWDDEPTAAPPPEATRVGPAVDTAGAALTGVAQGLTFGAAPAIAGLAEAAGEPGQRYKEAEQRNLE